MLSSHGPGSSLGQGNLLSFIGWHDDKESACNSGDTGSIPGLERSPGEGKDYPLQYSGLDNSMVSERVGYD